jgi:hypothetical protein
MRAISSSRLLSACFLALCLMVAGAGTAAAQAKLQQSPGGYHGELDFPIDWKRYYTFAERTKLIHDIQAKYSQLADIQSIGKSRMGRDQWLLTITAKSTGAPETKPAMWVDGAIHGNEVNGITCALYVMWYLLTRYDYDPFVKDLVDNTTFYILPGLNVDANDSYVSFPNTANNPREPYRPEDDDGDGLYDEDQTEDVDGDGELSMMYVEDAFGPLKLSPDGRRFIPITDETEKVKRFRLIGPEGFDNDGDGRINEDDLGGPDPNRNFSYGWTLDAGWPYPLSEPETRNVWEFQRTHPNIFATFNFHNTGRLIMFMAPNALRPGTQAQARPGGGGPGQLPVAERLAQLREENKYAQLFDRQVAPQYQHDLDVQTKMVTVGARLLKDYRPTFSGLSGQHQATAYGMLGAYAYLMELWGDPIFADINNDGQVSEEETMLWIDMELHGEGWIMPHEVNHPDLGKIWIGGTQKKHMERTPPSRYMEEEALKVTDFVLYSASQFPKVEIDRIRVTPEAGNLYWVDVTVKNDRTYPTSSDRENALGTAVKDKLLFRSGGGVQMLPIPSRAAPPENARDPSPRYASVGEDTYEFRLKGQDAQTFRYLVEGSESGWVELQVESFFGGKATKRITLREGM